MIQNWKTLLIMLVILTTSLISSFGVGVFGAEGLTGNDILVKVDQKSEMVTQGEILSIVTLDDVKPDGTTTTLKFAALARKTVDSPDRTLTYLLAPENFKGSIFLSRDTAEGESRMWSYLPAAGRKIEIPSSQEGGSFFGTAITYEEIGSWSLGEAYNAEIVEETTVEIEGESLPAYRLNLTGKEGADPRFPTETIWVSKDSWVLLHTKSFNASGELQKEMKVLELATFEGNTVTQKLVTTEVETGHSTTVIYEKRARPDRDVPDSVFDPENLSSFDREKWGLVE